LKNGITGRKTTEVIDLSRFSDHNAGLGRIFYGNLGKKNNLKPLA
jgi:hypothetical protein